MSIDNKGLDIVFLGLAQNCEQYLDHFFNLIKKIKKEFKIKVLIGENGSSDFTFDKIQKNIKDNKDIIFIDTTFIEQFSDRIKRLAHARQKLKDELIKKNYKPKFICVVDLDDVISQNFNVDLIKNIMSILEENNDKYFAASLSSSPYYYDILNFESDEFPNASIKKLQNNKSINSYQDRKEYIYDVQKKLSIKENFECISAFNGLCIYFFRDFISSDYLENQYDLDPEPEHLVLNRKIYKKNGKKIFVTKNRLKMPEEHKPHNNFILFIIQKIFKYIGLYIKKE